MNQAYNSPYYNPFSTPTFDNFVKLNEQIVKTLFSKRADLYRKWQPVIERLFSDIRLSEETISDICIYSELNTIYYDQYIGKHQLVGNELSIVLSDIKDKILDKSPLRSGVIRKVYNYRTGYMEYELDDGNFIRISGESVVGPNIDVHKDIFCDEFFKHLDISSYRDMKIDKLI